LSFRVGIVSEQDLVNCRVRVRFPDRDHLSSWWLPIVVPKSQNDKSYSMPDVGEQVVCLMDARDEDGAVLGAIYSAADATPVQSANKSFHLTTKDGASFDYDRVTHVLDAKFSDGAEIKYDAGAHQLSISVPGGDIALKTAEHNTTLDTIIDTYNSHTHQDVQPGSGNSGAPNQEIS
jgi:phage baseplate assembly protein V